MAATLVYWPVKARGHAIVLLYAFAGQELIWEKMDGAAWPARKPSAPFGQLPILVDGDLTVAQSMAIFRYAARKFDLDGGSDLKDYGISEMMIEEANDLYNVVLKTKYGDNVKAAFEQAVTVAFPAHLANIEKLLQDGGSFGSRTLAGDIAFFAMCDIINDLAPEVLPAFPKISKAFEAFASRPEIAPLLGNGVPAYFTKPE